MKQVGGEKTLHEGPTNHILEPLRLAVPLPRLKQWVIAGSVYLIFTIAFLWPAITPWELGEYVRSRDYALTAAITHHTARSFIGLENLWDMPLYYPHRDTLCLSEPMITSAILSGPLMGIFGPAAGQNVYLYFCWWSAAMGMWAFLRHRGLDQSSAFLGGLIASFNPDKYWHLAGHAQLVFHTGFPLALLCIERAIMASSTKRWVVMFLAILGLQLFSGFYMMVIFGLWCLFLIPASAWWASSGNWLLLRRWLRVRGVMLLTGTVAFMLPLAYLGYRYSQFGRQMPHNTLETVMTGSANIKGYLRPPMETDRYVTSIGKLLVSAGVYRPSSQGENSQYLGLFPILLGVAGVLLGLRHILRMQGKQRRYAELIFGLSVAAVAITAFILSLGPYLRGVAGDGIARGARLPFAYLYAWIEPLRFIRAPARFAFIVEWALALAAASGLWLIRRRLRPIFAHTITVLVIAVVCFEYFPLANVRQSFPARRSELSGFLQSLPAAKPFVYATVPNSGAMLMQSAWHLVPTVDGYSGYAPLNTDAELAWFRNEFPTTRSLLMLERWGVNNVFVDRSSPPKKMDSSLRLIWTGYEGSLYEYTQTIPSFEQFCESKRAAAGFTTGAQVTPIQIISNFKALPKRWVASELIVQLLPDADTNFPRYLMTHSFAPFYILFPEGPMPPAVYTHMRIRLRISNWFNMRETGTLNWKTESDNRMSEERTIKFVIPADGQFHDLLVPLGEQISWLASDPISEVRLDLGSRAWNKVAVETLQFEQHPIKWSLPKRDGH